jgi:PAS domain S-box-containing protein
MQTTFLAIRSPLIYLVQVLCLITAYFVVAEINVSTINPHSLLTLFVLVMEGFALTAIILIGIRIVPIIFLIQLIFALNNNFVIEIALGIATINSVEMLLASFLFQMLHLRKYLHRMRDVRNLLILIFFILQPFNASLSSLLFWSNDIIDTASLKLFWWSEWFNHAIAQALITPLLLSFFTRLESLKRRLYKILLTLLLIVPISIMLLSQTQFNSLSIVFSVTTLLLIIVAVNLGMNATTLAAVIFAAIALFYTYHGQGVFIDQGKIVILDLNIFLFGIIVCSQFMAALFSEHQHIKAAFKSSEQRFIDIVNSSDSIVWEADAQTFNVTFVSSKKERLLGYSVSDWYKSGFWLQHVHPDDQKWAADYCVEATLNRSSYQLEYRFLTKNGDTIWLRDIVSVTFENARPCWLRGIIIDITEQKKAEQELQRSNTDLEQFAYAVSHDMRQPLRMVSSYLTLLETDLEQQLDTKTRQFIEFAVEGANRMDQMILALLDFSKVGRNNTTLQPIDTQQALNEALAFLAPEIKNSHATIKVTGQWITLLANQDELTRLLQNLIDNALKYHQKNQAPKIEIIATVVKNIFQVAVIDHGIGIEPKQVKRLFKVFSRLHSRRDFEGTGVGLALCRKIVESHAGKIWVEAKGDGQGSVFRFILPIKQVDQS